MEASELPDAVATAAPAAEIVVAAAAGVEADGSVSGATPAAGGSGEGEGVAAAAAAAAPAAAGAAGAKLGAIASAPAPAAAGDAAELGTPMQLLHSEAIVSHGKVNYRLFGKPNPARPLIVMVHGITAGLHVWNRLAQELAAAGEYVLTYDMFGRGGSILTSPETEHRMPIFVGQLAELLLALGPETQYLSTRPIHLVGQSMGSAVCVGFTEVYGHLVRRLVLMAPAGLPLDLPWAAGLLKLPGLGDLAAAVADVKTMTKDLSVPFFQKEHPASRAAINQMQRFMEQQFVVNKTYTKGLVSTFRHFPLGTLEKSYIAIGKQQVSQDVAGSTSSGSSSSKVPRPTLIVWGKEDKVTPFPNHVAAQKHIPHASFLILDNDGHIDHLYALYDTTRDRLFEFLEVARA